MNFYSFKALCFASLMVTLGTSNAEVAAEIVTSEDTVVSTQSGDNCAILNLACPELRGTIVEVKVISGAGLPMEIICVKGSGPGTCNTYKIQACRPEAPIDKHGVTARIYCSREAQ